MSTVKSSVITTNGTGMISLTADAMAPISAPIFTVFATRISVTAADQYLFAVIFPDDLRDPFFRHRADPGARFLHCRHERIEKNRRPKLAVTELRARLRIGRDARRIVICRARDEAGTKNPENPGKPGFRVPFHLVWIIHISYSAAPFIVC